MEYSALNFEHFRDAQIERLEKFLQGKKEESVRAAGKILTEAETRGKALLEACAAEVEEADTQRRREQGIRAGLESRREHYASIEKQNVEIKEAVRRRLEEEFDELAGCFLRWLEREYESGSVTVFPEFDGAIPAKFRVHREKGRSIRFSKENLFIEFSVETLMEEYAGEINRLIRASTGV